MIRAIRYKSFKKYSDVHLNLEKAITVLVGPNSSGKSSLIKGLLAFKQTYGDPADHIGFIAQGQYVDIGNFIEYAKGHDAKSAVTFVFELSVQLTFAGRHPSKVFIEIEHRNDPQTGHGRVSAYKIFLPYESDISIDKYEECENVLTFQRMNKVDESFRIDMSERLFDIISEYSRNRPVSTGLTYDKLSKHLKSASVQAKRDNNRGMTISYERVNIPEDVVNFTFILERLILSRVHTVLFNDVTERTFALASLREKPVRSMKLTDERMVVGPTGSHMAAVYHNLRQRAIKAGKRNSKVKEDHAKLDGWFERLRLGKEIEINNWRDLIDLRTGIGGKGNPSDSIVDVGVGFSQAAPILVQLAAMPPDARLIVEQPELHLYPWAQTRLGEVLCEEAHRGRKKIVLETHSEHIVHGIQLHLSKSRLSKDSGLSANDVQILYVDSETDLQEITINDYGEFEKRWPDGFFDQTLDVYKAILENRLK